MNTSGPKLGTIATRLALSNGSEDFVLGEVESTGCQYVPTVGEPNTDE